MNKITVVIRNKNQSKSLGFLLKILNERYIEDIAEIIVIDNMSIDNSDEVANKYGAKVIKIENFSYGGSANLAAESSVNNVIVIFSAHSFPVSHDFFKQIIIRFDKNPNLAGLRCLHNSNDYTNYLENISSKLDPNLSGLIFSGSAFNKKVWEKYHFKDNIQTFEDKEWTCRVLKNGFDVDFSPSIFCYNLKRSKAQLYFRFKNELIGGYQLWHTEFNVNTIVRSFVGSIKGIATTFFTDFYYAIKRLFFMLWFLFNKPEKF